MKSTPTQATRQLGRGEIFYIVPDGEIANDLLSSGGRPAIIVSNDMNNALDGTVEVVYLTRHPWADTPTNVDIYATGQKSTALCSQISTVTKRRIGKYVGQVNEHEMKRLEQALSLSIGLNLNHLQSRDTVAILEEWKREIAKHPCEYAMDNTAEDMDEKLFANVIVTDPKNDLPDAHVVKESSEELRSSDLADKPVSLSSVDDVKMHPEYLKLQAERDMLQSMYDKLLNTVMGG